MSVPQTLNVHRHDNHGRTLLTLTGEVDLASVCLLRESLVRCLHDGFRIIDVDLASVAFCDCVGLDAFVEASRRTAAAGGSLRLHRPRPIVTRLISLTDTGFLLADPGDRVRASRPGDRPTRVGAVHEKAVVAGERCAGGS
jgi:anti-sigma B factor antagonist